MKIEEYKQAARTLNAFVFDVYLYRAGILLRGHIRENNEAFERLKHFIKDIEFKIPTYGPPPFLAALPDLLTQKEREESWNKIQERLNQEWPPVHPVCGLRRLSDKK